MKLIFDFISALFGLIILLPVFLVIGIIIFFGSKGPVLFTQKRVGKGGKLFTIYKFRTMYLNDGKNTISVKGDSRITSIGRFLRKYKLDELPELLNVLFGKMSFVGPRPDVQGYADILKGEERLILKLRPGITGPASLKYADEEELLANSEDPLKFNNEVIYPDKIKINLEYYHNRTFWLDLKIILKTIFR
ncbi:MAG: sugar transferase [Bacteroidota bacterium]